jgi:micrococcal nuclease
MGELLALLGLGGIVFGVVNLFRPTGRLGIGTRKHARRVVYGSFGALILGSLLLPPDESAAEQLTATPTTSVIESTTSTTATTIPQPSTTFATTTTIPLPSVPAAEIIFASPTASPSGDPTSPLPSDATVATVTSITDGDTLDVRLPDGTLDSVRLIGVNTPERNECWAAESALALAMLAPEGSQVGLTVDTSERDQFDRLLRYLWVGGLSVNEELIRRGAAISRRYPPDTSMASRFESAQSEAQASRLGLWAPDACGPPAEATLTIVDWAYDPAGDDNQKLNEEWVVIRNDGNNLSDMTGWGIKDESASHRYVFPDGFSLAPGESVRVHTGCGDDFGTDLFWCSVGSAIWNNDGDTVFVTDPSGNTHTSQSHLPPTTTTTSTTTTAPPPISGGTGGGCHPSYQGECIPIGVEDADCKGGSGNGPYYVGRVTVVGPDVFDLDRDGDGVGCQG